MGLSFMFSAGNFRSMAEASEGQPSKNEEEELLTSLDRNKTLEKEMCSALSRYVRNSILFIYIWRL